MTEGKQQLFQEVELNVGLKNLARIEIPAYITDNIRYPLFDWQKSALQHFLAYENPDNDLVAEAYAPTHLLFNMATGTGKTLLMAALILYYYKKGYRHFIFFVNQNNIVGKTEENLINPSHNKYLFKQSIVIDDKTIRVKKVQTFSNKTDDIQILFTSIHKLHNSVYTVEENSVYLDDLQKKKIVMLGDEAHHLNADTKKGSGEQLELELTTPLSEKASETDLEKSWENTAIKKILYKGQYPSTEKNNNVLLEFTATIPRDEYVKEKYRRNTIFSFDLKDFLQAGYTKEINLVSSSFDKKKRIIQALLLNWYRNKIALKYGLQNFKPVILFRSKLIVESLNDFEEFKVMIKSLSAKDFAFIEKYEEEKFFGNQIYEQGKSRIIDIKHFIADYKINWSEIISYLKYTFADRNCIITNSKAGTKTKEKTTDEQEKQLNSLEDKSNKVAAIFTVQRLTEGWDVLNLFDIVRLYEGQNEGGSNTKTSEATTSEVQLIGRGVRYYPFAYENKPLLKRKFDDNLEHELRVLEEFYYHSDDEHRYLSQLKNELKNKGYIDEKKKVKTFALKKEFKDSDFYKTVKLWLNEQQVNPDSRKLTLKEIKKDFEFSYVIPLTSVSEEEIVLDKDADKKRYATKQEDSKTISPLLNEFPKHIIRKAINIKATKDLSFFRFAKLKDELSIEKIDEILDDKYLGDLKLNIITPKTYKDLNDVSNENQLNALLRFFDKIENHLKEISNPFIGSEFSARKFSEVFEEAKEKLVEENDESKTLEKELVQKNWYVLDSFNGTSEERNLIYFLKKTMGNLESKYEQVFLLRNEEVYIIYDFSKGRGFQPDFLLFLKQKNKNLYYQVFIEPKGDQFKDETGGFGTGKEGWKENFFEEISAKYGDTNILKFESKDYKLIGLPLYNEKKKNDFRLKYNQTLEVE
jgi:type III restriction enzyme